MRALVFGSLGVVFGDIGTSPLYALKSCFLISGMSLEQANIIGLVSLISWILFLLVTFKYINFILKFDNNGEGGVLALSSLCAKISNRSTKFFVIGAGILGAALFLSDGVITPAISVLSAVEGMELISPKLERYVVPVSICLLVMLFLVQKKGTAVIGRFFGVVMFVWFLVLGMIGAYNIWLSPAILEAVNPLSAIKFFMNNGMLAFATLGAGILVITGAESLYADLGHFGKKPITYSWCALVMPCLLLNYLGQGGLLIAHPEAINSPFYSLVPSDFLYPLIILATIATILASQSVISGVFSVAWQGIMLEYLPRMKVEHTSEHQIGQVYIPTINYFLCIMTILAVMKFGSSESLSIAYGLSVSGTMLISTLMILFIAVVQLKWKLYRLIMIFSPLVLLDVTFVITNLSKIVDGAWYSILITILVFSVIRVWRLGNMIIDAKKYNSHKTLAEFFKDYQDRYSQRIPGAVIFMTRNPEKVPNSLLLHLNHNKFMHEKMVFLSLVTKTVPRVRSKDHFKIVNIAPNVFSVVVEYGFKEVPSLKKIMYLIKESNIIEDNEITFFLSKGEAVASNKSLLNDIAQRLYLFLSRNSLSAYEFYDVPTKNVVVLSIRYMI